MKKILIAGYHGFGNCGDEATLGAMTKNIPKHIEDVEITALSNDVEDTKAQYKINAVSRFSIIAVLRAIKSCDILLFGSGSLLQDETSTRSLVYYLSIVMIAKLFKKKVMLYANGIGPVSKNFNRQLIKKVINKVDIITLREGMSAHELRDIGVVRPQVYVTADPAFMLEGTKKERVHQILENEGVPLDKKIIGIAIREWQNSDHYLKVLAEVIEYLDQGGMTVLLIPMQYPNDLAITRKLQRMTDAKTYMLTNKYKSEETLGIVGELELMISMRLHSLLFAAIQRVPMLGIEYDPKIEYYLRELRMPSLGNINKDKLSAEATIKAIQEMCLNKQKYVQILDEVAHDLLNKSLQNDVYLKELIEIMQEDVPKKVDILGVAFDNVTMSQAMAKVTQFISEGGHHYIVTANPEIVMHTKKDEAYANILKQADMVVPDGIGVIYASRFVGERLAERVPGIELMHSMLAYAEQNELSVYFIGGAENVARRAAKRLRAQMPNLKIVGARSGYFDEAGERRILQDIKAKKPDMLFVGLGFPKQEKWIFANKDLPVKVAMGVGGCFDVFSGKTKRAPLIFQKFGLEWFHRLLLEPRRILRMMSIPLFILHVVTKKGK